MKTGDIDAVQGMFYSADRDLAVRIQAFCPDLKILFMSGYTADVIAHRGVLDAGVHFIQKPFSRSDLARKVRHTLGGVRS